MDLYEKYRLTEFDMLSILQDGTVVFDTSALLDLYYYSLAVQDELFNTVLPKFSGRLWLPSQVYLEFIKNQKNVADKPAAAYMGLINKSHGNGGYVKDIVSTAGSIKEDELQSLKGFLQTLKETTKKNNKHPFLNGSVFESLDESIQQFENCLNEFGTQIDKFESEITVEIEKKITELKTLPIEIQQNILKHFSIGEELSYGVLLSIAKEGYFRYADKIPPGYEDAKKEGLQKYGDLFVWKEILGYASNAHTDVFLVTNDRKVDWWDKEHETPRLELLREFESETGHKFWSCNISDFLYYVTKLPDAPQIPSAIIDEIQLRLLDSESEALEQLKLDENYNLYTEVLDKWLKAETGTWIAKPVVPNPEWRAFGNYYVYLGDSYEGTPYIIMLNIVTSISYASLLHSFLNLKEVKSFYEHFGKKYEYIQIIAAKSKGAIASIIQLMDKKPKLQKAFNSKSVQNTLVYLEDGNFIYVDANHPVG